MMGYKLSSVNLLFKKISGNVNQLQSKTLRMTIVNSIALRKAKIAYNFGLSECNRVKECSNLSIILRDKEGGEDVSISPHHLPKLYRLFCNISAGSADLTHYVKLL